MSARHAQPSRRVKRARRGNAWVVACSCLLAAFTVFVLLDAFAIQRVEQTVQEADLSSIVQAQGTDAEEESGSADASDASDASDAADGSSADADEDTEAARPGDSGESAEGHGHGTHGGPGGKPGSGKSKGPGSGKLGSGGSGRSATSTDSGTTTNATSDSGTLIVSIIIIVPSSVDRLNEKSAISCDSEVSIISISLVIRDKVSPYLCLSKYEIGSREIFCTI